VGPALAQPTLRITAPADKTVVAPGKTFTVTVTSSSARVFQFLTVIGEQPIGFHPTRVLTAPPWQVRIEVPSNIAPGLYAITAVSSGSGGEPVESEPIEVDVERPDDPVTMRDEAPYTVLAVGEQTPILVSGIYSDGTKLLLTNSTKTAYSYNDTSVATVDAKGLIIGVAPGTTKIRIMNGATSAFVSVKVRDAGR